MIKNLRKEEEEEQQQQQQKDERSNWRLEAGGDRIEIRNNDMIQEENWIY
jgi:hypothetical protein